MARILYLLFLMTGAAAALAQQDAESNPGAGEAEAQEAADATDPTDAETDEPASDIDPELFEDIGLDEQTYEEDEDEFIPTEEIPADEPIPFPTDI